jgi:hypothetical protein
MMPRSKDSEIVLEAHGAYIFAIASSFAITYIWLFSNQATLFLVGLSAQYVVYLVAMSCKYVFKKFFKTRGM